jgi:hypothetical protein
MAIHQPLREQRGIGTACYGCGRKLPLRLTQVGEEASLWECAHCHTPFAGVLSPEALRALSRRIRLAQLHFDVQRAAPLSDALLQVMWRNAAKIQRKVARERRRSRRHTGHRDVIAMCLDDRYHLIGPPIHGVVANLSRHGLHLVTTTQVTSPAVITQFQHAGRTIQLLGRVVWTRYLDVGCYGAGVGFIARFGRAYAD